MRNGFLTLTQRAQCGVSGTRRVTPIFRDPLLTSLDLLMTMCSMLGAMKPVQGGSTAVTQDLDAVFNRPELTPCYLLRRTTSGK